MPKREGKVLLETFSRILASQRHQELLDLDSLQAPQLVLAGLDACAEYLSCTTRIRSTQDSYMRQSSLYAVQNAALEHPLFRLDAVVHDLRQLKLEEDQINSFLYSIMSGSRAYRSGRQSYDTSCVHIRLEEVQAAYQEWRAHYVSAAQFPPR